MTGAQITALKAKYGEDNLHLVYLDNNRHFMPTKRDTGGKLIDEKVLKWNDTDEIVSQVGLAGTVGNDITIATAGYDNVQGLMFKYKDVDDVPDGILTAEEKEHLRNYKKW